MARNLYRGRYMDTNHDIPSGELSAVAAYDEVSSGDGRGRTRDGTAVLAAVAPAPVGRALIDLPYTAAADPEIEADIRSLLEQITSAVVAELQPAAVLVRGSLGRGEGGAFRAGRETQLTTDVDLVAVTAGRNAMVRAWHERRRTAVVRDTLAETLAVSQLDLVAVPARVLRDPPPSLATFELLRSSRLLYGTAQVARPSAVPLEFVPVGDFVRRLRRAGNGLLTAWSRLGVGEGNLANASARAVRSAVDAAFLACGDTWLFRTRHYDHRLAMRAEWLRLPFAAGPGLTDRLRQEYQFAAREQLFPSARIDQPRAELAGRWEQAVVAWLGCAQACRQRAWWGRYGLRTGQGRRSAWPLRRALTNLVDATHDRDAGGIPVRTQRLVLPLLLEWTLDGWDDPGRRDRIASLLHLRREESRDLPYLVLKYLNDLQLPSSPRATTTLALPAFGSRH